LRLRFCDDDIVDAQQVLFVCRCLQLDEAGFLQLTVKEPLQGGGFGMFGAFWVLAMVADGAFGDAGEMTFCSQKAAVAAMGNDQIRLLLHDGHGKRLQKRHQVIQISA
jgi:hypothetical protein